MPAKRSQPSSCIRNIEHFEGLVDHSRDVGDAVRARQRAAFRTTVARHPVLACRQGNDLATNRPGMPAFRFDRNDADGRRSKETA